MGSSSVHVVQKNPQNFHKKKFKQELKQKVTTPFKKKTKNRKTEIASLVVSPDIMLGSARRAIESPKKRNLETWMRLMKEHRGMVIYYL